MATWLRDALHDALVPCGRAIADEYASFQAVVPAICEVRRLQPEEITFTDFRVMAAEWVMAENDGPPAGPR